MNIRQAKYVPINHIEMRNIDGCVEKVEAALPYPVFVKPSKAGSSVGVNKAVNREELTAALKEAIKHDIHILVEEAIVGREIECAVLGGYAPEASDVGEVLSAEDFYTFDAKYNNQESKTDLHPVFPEERWRKFVRMPYRFLRHWMVLDAPVWISLWKRIRTKWFSMKSIPCRDSLLLVCIRCFGMKKGLTMERLSIR